MIKQTVVVNPGQYYEATLDAVILSFESKKKFQEQGFNDVAKQLIIAIVEQFCVPHPLYRHIDVYAPISLILDDVKQKKWKKAQIIYWLKSLKESKSLVVRNHK